MTKREEMTQSEFSWMIGFIGFLILLVISIVLFVSFISDHNKIYQENKMLKGQIQNYSCQLIIIGDTVELDILNWDKPIERVVFYFDLEKSKKLLSEYNLDLSDCEVLKNG